MGRFGVSGAFAGKLTAEVEVLGVRRVAHPQSMEKDGQLACDSYDRPLLGVLPASSSDRLPESS